MAKTVLEKLGWKSGMSLRLFNLPDELRGIFDKLTANSELEVIVCFVRNSVEISEKTTEAIAAYR
jgi:hypothetical protein